MIDTGTISEVNDHSLRQLLTAERAILILTRSDCGPCEAYQGEIQARLEGAELPGIAIGKLVLDHPGSPRFKRENPWLSGLKYLPYTVLFKKGQCVDGFAASRVAYLLERIEDYLPESN